MKTRDTLLTFLISVCQASQSAWNVKDDFFAFPQYDISFTNPPISVEDAAVKLDSRQNIKNDLSKLENAEDTLERWDYERLILHGRPYLCSTPIIELNPTNSTGEDNEENQEKELIRAADKGRELLKDMEGSQCLFYTTGWWTYSFCYNQQVKQFHALPLGSKGVRVWPPKEDPEKPTFILGKYDPTKATTISGSEESTTEIAELQTNADTNYLVQRLEGGTPCDLTGKERKIEIQYHCNPQLTDRIGWIKETVTCAYLMVVYTPRLCNDVAFQPPKDSKGHMITCQEISSLDEHHRLPGQIEDKSQFEQNSDQSEQRVLIGDVELGAMKYVGKDGKKIEKGSVVLTDEEKGENPEIIMMRKDGKISDISKLDFKRLQIDRKYLEEFVKEVEQISDSQDWRIEKLDNVDGKIQLKVVFAVEEDKPNTKPEKQTTDGDNTGSEEEYKDEI